MIEYYIMRIIIEISINLILLRINNVKEYLNLSSLSDLQSSRSRSLDEVGEGDEAQYCHQATEKVRHR